MAVLLAIHADTTHSSGFHPNRRARILAWIRDWNRMNGLDEWTDRALSFGDPSIATAVRVWFAHVAKPSSLEAVVEKALADDKWPEDQRIRMAKTLFDFGHAHLARKIALKPVQRQSRYRAHTLDCLVLGLPLFRDEKGLEELLTHLERSTTETTPLATSILSQFVGTPIRSERLRADVLRLAKRLNDHGAVISLLQRSGREHEALDRLIRQLGHPKKIAWFGVPTWTRRVLALELVGLAKSTGRVDEVELEIEDHLLEKEPALAHTLLALLAAGTQRDDRVRVHLETYVPAKKKKFPEGANTALCSLLGPKPELVTRIAERASGWLPTVLSRQFVGSSNVSTYTTRLNPSATAQAARALTVVGATEKARELVQSQKRRDFDQELVNTLLDAELFEEAAKVFERSAYVSDAYSESGNGPFYPMPDSAVRLVAYQLSAIIEGLARRGSIAKFEKTKSRALRDGIHIEGRTWDDVAALKKPNLGVPLLLRFARRNDHARDCARQLRALFLMSPWVFLGYEKETVELWGQHGVPVSIDAERVRAWEKQLLATYNNRAQSPGAAAYTRQWLRVVLEPLALALLELNQTQKALEWLAVLRESVGISQLAPYVQRRLAPTDPVLALELGWKFLGLDDDPQVASPTRDYTWFAMNRRGQIATALKQQFDLIKRLGREREALLRIEALPTANVQPNQPFQTVGLQRLLANVLELLLLVEQESPRARTLLRHLIERGGSFAEWQYGRMARLVDDEVLRLIAETAWKQPALREWAPRVLTSRVENALDPYGFYLLAGVSTARNEVRAIEMLHELGDHQRAIEVARALLDRACSDTDVTNVIIGGSDLERLARAWQRGDCVARGVSVVREVLERGDGPSVLRTSLRDLLATIERDDAAPPGIVLALSPAGQRIDALWQLHRKVARDHDGRPWEEWLRSTQRARTVVVPFVSGDKAIDPSGYSVVIECGPGPNRFDRRWKFDGKHDLDAQRCGRARLANAPEQAFYRAILMRGGERVASSPVVFGMMAPSLLGPNWAVLHGEDAVEALSAPGPSTNWMRSSGDLLTRNKSEFSAKFDHFHLLSAWVHVAGEGEATDARLSIDLGDRSAFNYGFALKEAPVDIPSPSETAFVQVVFWPPAWGGENRESARELNPFRDVQPATSTLLGVELKSSGDVAWSNVQCQSALVPPLGFPPDK